MTEIISEKIKQATFIKASPEKVYDTITSADAWDTFFTTGMQLDPRVGGWIEFRWKDWGPDFYTMSAGGPVLEAVRPRRFIFQWGARFVSTVAFELHAEYGGTTVRLTETGYPDTPEGRCAMLECASGWGEALTLLKFYIEHGIVYTPPQK